MNKTDDLNAFGIIMASLSVNPYELVSYDDGVIDNLRYRVRVTRCPITKYMSSRQLIEFIKYNIAILHLVVEVSISTGPSKYSTQIYKEFKLDLDIIFGLFKCLKVLRLTEIISATTILSTGKYLETLKINDCFGIKSIIPGPALRRITIFSLDSLVSIGPTLPEGFISLSIYHCEALKFIPRAPYPKSLCTLSLSNSMLPNLELPFVPEISRVTNIKFYPNLGLFESMILAHFNILLPYIHNLLKVNKPAFARFCIKVRDYLRTKAQLTHPAC